MSPHQNPSKVHSRSGPMCGRHICSPTGTPKIRNRARGSSRPSQDTGLPQAFPCIRHTGRQVPLVPRHPRGLQGRIPQYTWIGAVARGSSTPVASTPTSASNIGGGCGCFFYREGLQAPPQPARSAKGTDTGILGGKNPACPKKEEEETQMRRDRGGKELWEVEGTHCSLGKNPPTTTYMSYSISIMGH